MLELITALVLATTPVQTAAPPELPGLGALIDEHVATAMAEEKVPGVTVTVVAGGRQVVNKGYGLANVERWIPGAPVS